MAQKIPFPDVNDVDSLKKALSRRRYKITVAEEMAARGLLDMSVAAVLNRSFLHTFADSLKSQQILVSPCKDGETVDFYVPSLFRNDVHVLITPESFDLRRSEERRRLAVYKAFISLLRSVPLRKTPDSETNERSRLWGVFQVFCDKTVDEVRWKAVWSRWSKVRVGK
jgi:hypothetical protein